MGFLSAIGTIAGSYFGGPVGGAIGNAAGSFGDSLIAGDSSGKVSDAQRAGVDAATKLQADIYNQNRKDNAPYRDAGGAASEQLSYLLGLNLPNTTNGVNTYDPVKDTTDVAFTYQPPNNLPVGTYQMGNQPINGLYPVYKDGKLVAQNPVGPTASGNNQHPVGASTTNGSTGGTGYYKNTNTGIGGFGSLSKSFGVEDFKTDPGYEFRLSEGQKALERSQAAKGNLLSGAAVKAAARFGQDTASQEYNNAYNRYNANQTNLYNKLAGISGAGQTANSADAASGTNYANNAGNLAQESANINANNIKNQANNWSTGLNGIASSFSSFGGSSNAPVGGYNFGASSSLPWSPFYTG